MHEGNPAYSRCDGAFWLWRDMTHNFISAILGDDVNPHWDHFAVNGPPGNYNPQNGAEGIATVAAV